MEHQGVILFGMVFVLALVSAKCPKNEEIAQACVEKFPNSGETEIRAAFTCYFKANEESVEPVRCMVNVEKFTKCVKQSLQSKEAFACFFE